VTPSKRIASPPITQSSLVADGEPVLLLVSGANRVDLNEAAKNLRVARVEGADAEIARAATGYPIRATSLLGLTSHLRIVIDQDLLGHHTVWASAGRPDSGSSRSTRARSPRRSIPRPRGSKKRRRLSS
jgi:prolyl-tRNA editing enzyme YbaK/EbsC (Cys-tRNA(Pro) deacylase)